jgi:hypothetical protein
MVKLRLQNHGQIEVYDPMAGVGAIRSLASADEVSIAMTDHPVIVQIEQIKNR